MLFVTGREKRKETFEWTNSGDKDCVITGCQPPLKKSSYTVKKRRVTKQPSKRMLNPGDVPGPIEPQPVIKIGG